jgi:photosystem II stability/assembly factor-like uncharacterized protein
MNTKRMLLIILLWELGLCGSIAQTPTWKNITPPGWSGTFQFTDWFDGNGIIAIANNGYFYNSTDTGKTWQVYPEPVSSVSCIKLYPDHKRAYICGGNHLYKTTDAAKTWQEISYTGIPASMNISNLYIKTEDTLFVAASDINVGMNIYLSPDKGQTWKQVASKLVNDSVFIAFDLNGFYFVTSKHGYALGYGYYAETLDAGQTWKSFNTNMNQWYPSLCEIPGSPTVISVALPPNGTFPSVQNAQFYNGGIYKITRVGTMLYGVYEGNLFSSVDSGKTWKIKTIDIDATLQSITFLNQKTGIAVGRYLSSYKTTDGGTTWTKYVYGGAEGFKHIYCKTKDDCFISGETGRLFHTKDGGQTWDYQDLNRTTLQQIVFPTPDTGYISASGVILRTINGGINWTKFANDGNNGGFLCFPQKDTGYIGYASTGWIDKTLNAGQTWNIAVDNTYMDNIGLGGNGANFRSTQEGLVAGDNSLLYTNDGGNSWQVKGNGIIVSSIIYVKDNWLLTTYNGKIYLCDKDVNFSIKYNDSKDNYSIPVKRNDSTIYMLATNDSVLFSTDYGNTWHKYKDSILTNEFSFGDFNHIYTINTITNSIYKGILKSNTISSAFSLINIQTISCIIKNDMNESYNATIEIITNKPDTIKLQQTISVGNNLPVQIPIPSTVADITSYKIRIVPVDTIAYSIVESQTFIKTDVPEIENKNGLPFRVIERKIVSDNNIDIYNTLGQLCLKDNDLPIGVYFVTFKNSIYKIIIKP